LAPVTGEEASLDGGAPGDERADGDSLHDVVTAIDDRSARGIAAGISRLVTSGRLAEGTRLPTVRELARQLGTSPTTVSEAWQTLARIGAIESRGRLGTFVLDGQRHAGPTRYRRVTEGPGHFRVDLSSGTPDPDLLPDLGELLARVGAEVLTTSYLDDQVIPALDEVLRATWAFAPEGLTVVDGAMDAMDRLASLVLRLGDRVLVENPTFPPLLDVFEQMGVEVIGLDLDEHGIVPGVLATALEREPVALFLQPRAHNPAGVSMSARRASDLARVLRPTSLWIIEDDHSGDIAKAPDVSLGTHLPAQTVHIRSYSKSHGPDLRLAAVGGAGDLVGRLAERRLLGPGWSSRILQAVLVELLRDERAKQAVADARTTYAGRRAAMVAALHERGVHTTGSDGINLWVEVRDERTALVTLAAQGIGVAPGTPFVVEPLDHDHVRVTVGLVRDNVDELADRLAVAALGSPRRGGRV
jgi:DNA-binding transcriptional MocR family regulator